MNTIAGVETKEDKDGNITEVTIDVAKHKDVMMPVLEKLGLLTKTEFIKEFETCIPLSEAQEHTLQFARSLWNK